MNAPAQFVAAQDPAILVRAVAMLVCVFASSAFIALVCRLDRRRLRIDPQIDPYAEPFGDVPGQPRHFGVASRTAHSENSHGFTAEQLAEFRGHTTPASVDPLRRSHFHDRASNSGGVALQAETGRGGPSSPSGAAAARGISRRP